MQSKLAEAGKDGWTKGSTFYSEKQAFQEYDWLTKHNYLREYLLVAHSPADSLNDEMPF